MRFARALRVASLAVQFFSSNAVRVHLPLFFTTRIPFPRARVITNLFLAAQHRITLGSRSRVRVKVCGVLQLSLSRFFLAHIIIKRH